MRVGQFFQNLLVYSISKQFILPIHISHIKLANVVVVPMADVICQFLFKDLKNLDPNITYMCLLPLILSNLTWVPFEDFDSHSFNF